MENKKINLENKDFRFKKIIDKKRIIKITFLIIFLILIVFVIAYIKLRSDLNLVYINSFFK